MLKVYTIDQDRAWDEIVKSFKAYDVYWLSGYVKGFYIHGDGTPLLIYCESDSARAINVVMRRDIADIKEFESEFPKGQYFDFSSPYGYGGWIIEGDRIENLFHEYSEWAESNGIVSEFVRFHPMLGNHIECEGFYDVSMLGEVVHMDLCSNETIWANITSKNRNTIRKAIKNDIKIYNGRAPVIFEAFREIYADTMQRVEANEYYYFGEEFFKSVLEDLPHNAQIFYAVRNHTVIAASIFLTANDYMNYHLAGSLAEYNALGTSNLLLYRAAQWGCANGYRLLFLGGGVGSSNDGLLKFKKAFNRGNQKHFYVGKKVFNKKMYEKLLSLRKDRTASSYFPLYRA